MTTPPRHGSAAWLPRGARLRFLSIVIAVLVSLDIAAREVVFAQAAAATSYSGVANSISSSAPIAACDKSGGMGLSRVVEIDTSGGPALYGRHPHLVT